MTEPVPTRSPIRRALVWTVRGLVLLGLLTIGGVVFRVLAGSNEHTVVTGQVYRSAQPSPEVLRNLVERHGIRTVINLRGTAQHLDDPRSTWYRDETLTTHELDLSQEDITLSARLLPPPNELRRLIEVLDRTQYPILIHCKQGADRTGLVSALYLLLHTDASVSEARRQLWPWYGHIDLGPTAAMDDFFDRYEDWLKAEGVDHTSVRFRQWATTVYQPGVARSEIVLLDPIPNPLRTDQSFAVRVRVTNRSHEVWEFRPGDYAAIHLSYVVANTSLEPVVKSQAGLMRRSVAPGESVELTLAVPPIPVPGSYNLVAQMIDARGAGVPIRSSSFVKFGDEALMVGLVVQ